MDEHDPKRWTCESCTFANISKNRHCGVCLNPRPKSLKQRQRQSGGVKASSNDTTTESEESAANVFQEAEVKLSVAPTESTEMSSDSSVQPQILDESYHNFCDHVWANLNKTESLTALHQEGQSAIVGNGQLKSDGDGGEMRSGKEEENVNHIGIVSAEVPRVEMTKQDTSDGVGSQEAIAVKPEQIILTAQDFVFPATHHSLSNRQNAPMDVDDEDTSLGGDAGEAWQCLKCTFANNSRFVKCDLCGLKRPRAPKSASKKSHSAGTNDEFVVPTVINLARTSRSSDKSTVKDEKIARSLTEPPHSPVSTGMKRTASQSSIHRSPRPTLWNKTAESASKSNNPMLNIVNNINDFLDSSNTSVNNDNPPAGDVNHPPLADTHSLLSLGQLRADKHSREQSGDDEQEGRDTWECSQCTLENSFKNKRCSVCGNRGPKSSGRSHQNTPGSVRRARPAAHDSDGGGSPKRQRREDRPQADDHRPDETNEKSEDDESEEQEVETSNRRSQSRGRRRKGSGFTRIKRHVRGRNTRDKKEQQQDSVGKDEKEDRGRSRSRPAENRPKDNSAPMNTVRRTSQNSRRRDPSPEESSEEETSDSETEAPPNVDPVTGKRKYDMTNRIKKGEVSKAAEKMLESSSRSNRRDARRSSERSVERQNVERSERSRSSRGDGDRSDRHRDRSSDRRGRRDEEQESSRRDRRAERGYDSSERHSRQRRPDRNDRDRNSDRRSRDRSDERDSRFSRGSRSRSERRGRRGSGSDEDENASEDSQHGSESEREVDNNGEKDKNSATEEVDDEPRDSRGRRIGARGSKGRAERRLSDQLSIDRPVEKPEKSSRPERSSQQENESEKEDKPNKQPVEDDVPRDRRGRRIGMRNAQHYARRREREEEERRRAEAGGEKSDENQKSGSEEEEQEEEKSEEEQEDDDEPRDSRGRRIGARGSKSRAEREGRILDNSRSRSRSQRDGGSRSKVEVDNEPRDRRGRRIGMRNAQHYARRREREEEEARRNGGQVPKETSSERHHHSSRSTSSRHSHSHRSSSHRHESEHRHSRSSSSRHHHSSRSHSHSHRDSASENQRSSRSSQHHNSSSQHATAEVVDDEPRDSRGRRIGARGKKHKQSHGSDVEPAAENNEQQGATSQGDPYVRPDRRFKANRHLPPNPRDRGARFNAMTYGNENGPADGQAAVTESNSNARPTRSSRGDGNDIVDYNTSLELLTILSRTQQRTGGDKSARKGYAPRKYKSDDPNNNFVSKGTKVGDDYQVSFLPPCDNAKHKENLAKHRPAPGSSSSYVPHPYNEDNELYSVLWFATTELDVEYIPLVENNLEYMEVAENNLDNMDVAEDYLEKQREVMGEIVSDILAQVHTHTSSSSGSNSSSCVTHPPLPLNIKTEPAVDVTTVSTAMEEDNYNPDTSVAADDDIINVSSSSESDELLPLQAQAMEVIPQPESISLPAAATAALEASLVKTEPALSQVGVSFPIKTEEISVSGELCGNNSAVVFPATEGVSDVSDPVFDASPALNTVDNSVTKQVVAEAPAATSTAAPIDFTAAFTDEKHDNWDRHSDANGSDSVRTSESSSNSIGDSDNVSGTESSSVDDDGSILTDELFSDENSDNENETETSDEDYVESISSDLGFGTRRSARKSSNGAATNGVTYADATGRGGFSRLLKATSNTSSYMSSSNGKNNSSEAVSAGFSSSFGKKSSPFDFLEFTREVEAHIAARTTPSSLYFKSAASVSDTHHKKVGANTMITNFIEAQLGLLETVCEYIDVIGEQRSEAVEVETSPAIQDGSEWELLSDDFDQYGDSPDEDMSVSAASEHSSVAALMDTSTDTVEIEDKSPLNVNEPADGTAVSDFSTALSAVLKSFNTLPDDLLAHGSVVCKEEHTETVPAVKPVAAPAPVEAAPKGVPKTMGRPTKAVLQARAAAALAAMNIAMLEPVAIAATQVETNQSLSAVSVVVSEVGTTTTVNTTSTAVVVFEEKSSAITTVDTAVVTHDDEDGDSSEGTECAPRTLLLRYLAQYPEMQVYALRTLYQSHYCVEAAEEQMATAIATAERERSECSPPLISASSAEICAIEDIKPTLEVSGADTSDPVPMEVQDILDSQSIGDSSSSSALTCTNHSTDILEPEKTPLTETSPAQQTLQTVLTDEEKITLYNSRPLPLVDHDIPTLTAEERQAFSEALVLHWDFWRDVNKELNNKWTISQLQGYFHCVYGTKHKTEKHATERKHKAHVRNIERQKERAALAAQDIANGTEKRVVVRGSREIRSLQAAYCDRRLSRSICAGASSNNNLSQEGTDPADQPYTLPSTRKTPSPQVQNNSNSSSLYSAGTTTLLSVLGAAALVVERVGNAFFDYDFNEQEEGTVLQTEEEGTPVNITPAGEAVNVTVTTTSELPTHRQSPVVIDAQTSAVTDTQQAKGLLGTPLLVGGIAVPLVVQPACALLFADEVGMVDLSSSDSEYSGAENDGDRGAAENTHEKHSDRRRSRERSRGSRGGSRSGSCSDSDGSRGSRMSVRSNGSSRSSGSSRSGDSRDSRRSRNSRDSQRGSVSSRSYSSGSDSDNHSQRSARRHKKTSKSTATLMINRSRSNSLSKYDMLAADKHTSSSGSDSDLGSGRFSGSGSEVDSPRKKPRRNEKRTMSLGDSTRSV